MKNVTLKLNILYFSKAPGCFFVVHHTIDRQQHRTLHLHCYRHADRVVCADTFIQYGELGSSQFTTSQIGSSTERYIYMFTGTQTMQSVLLPSYNPVKQVRRSSPHHRQVAAQSITFTLLLACRPCSLCCYLHTIR